tara:strand:+ start:56 stop:490 length:435 start_codon:yes stop_codon:yes gene_type:complete
MKFDYSELYIRNILEKVNTIAVIGASPTKTRDSYKVMEALIQNGYEIFPVNPKEAGNLILGKECYSDIKDIGEDIDLVDIFRKKNAVMDITIQAIEVGAKYLWMQEGIIHQEAAYLAQNAGLKVIMDRCPKKELSRPYWTNKIK